MLESYSCGSPRDNGAPHQVVFPVSPHPQHEVSAAACDAGAGLLNEFEGGVRWDCEIVAGGAGGDNHWTEKRLWRY